MAIELEIEAFDWSDKIIDHIWEHGVDPWEIEEVVFDDPEVEIRRVDDEEHGRRWIVQGRTAKGRKLRIYMNPCQERERIWYVITAWEEGR